MMSLKSEQSLAHSSSEPAFRSILFAADAGESARVEEQPAFFRDLNLDQVVHSIVAGREGYDLRGVFHAPLHDVDAIAYRHEVFRDLERPDVHSCVLSFAQMMREMREHLAQADELRYRYQQESWFLDAVEIYCDAVERFTRDLTHVHPSSRGFLAFREYLATYARSEAFTSLRAETTRLKTDLAAVKYSLNIKGARVRVSRYASELDYSVEVKRTFEKFKQGAVEDYRGTFRTSPDMNHVEARVLDFVALLHEDVFRALDDYCERHGDYLDPLLAQFDREVQFYIAYLEYTGGLRSAGLPFCYPDVTDRSKAIHASDAFDLALADKLRSADSQIVCNDFHLEGPERILVVTGPNQGGKTTFARMFGELHYLASIGCLVPCREARLFLYDAMFTHFEKEEDVENLTGKLEDDLLRIHEILQQATSNSIVIMNESFTSTTLEDAVLLSKQVIERIMRLDLLCLCVTFIDELASGGETTVSMVGSVVPENPAERTYKIARKPADGLAYAAAIAEKYRLTYTTLKERIGS